MTDWQLLFVSGLAVAALAFCLWKTQADWQQSGFNWRVAFGLSACLSTFLTVAFLIAASVMSDL
ncbi:hypothetical protein [Sphingomonas arenae]|uniref:hypothetical protein n=1 Tax=Sphingomonas arenae TaxID=2812555 RepID=UPI00196709BE|nr:hypothetical protein [Sphingomonas arenae]